MAANLESTPSVPDRTSGAPSVPTPRWLVPLSILNLAGLVASLGLAGFVLYQQHETMMVDPPLQAKAERADQTTQKTETKESKTESKVQDVAGPRDDRPTPTNYAPQIKTIEDRLADLSKSLAEVNDQYRGLGKRLDDLNPGKILEASPRFASVENRLTEVAGSLETVKAKLAAVTNPVALAADEMGQGVAYFKQGKWTEARSLFAKL